MYEVDSLIEWEASESFEHQFAQRERFDFYGESLEIIDVAPPLLIEDVPVVIAGGFSHGANSLESKIRYLFDSGRRVITVSPPRSNGHIPGITNDALELETKARAMMMGILKSDVEAVRLLGHSEGGPVCSNLGKLLYTKNSLRQYPFEILSMDLIAPAGLIGSDNILNLGIRAVQEVVANTVRATRREDVREPIKRITIDGINHVAKNPVRSLLEAKALSEATVEDDLEVLLGFGVDVAVYGLEYDKIFPPDKLKKVSQKAGLSRYIDVPGTMHDDPVMRPNRVLPYVVNRLNELLV